MRLLSIFIIATFELINGDGLNAQPYAPSISSGIVVSDIASKDKNYSDGNTWKKGYWISFRNPILKKKWFFVDTGLTYQERKALEVFALPFGENNTATGSTTNMWIFSQYPTSPQSEGFYTHGNEYIHLPNFKYLYLEIVPKVIFGNKIRCEVGVGLFNGILLNRRRLFFGREDFPNFDDFFEPPFNVFGEVRYHRYDFGWIPEIKGSYALSEKLRLGIIAKSHQSLVRLNDTFVAPALALNMRWSAFSGGLLLEYQF